MLPFHMAEDAGVDLRSCDRGKSIGIEGAGIDVYFTSLTFRFGGKLVLPLRCIITKSDQTPFLLGRVDIFDRFDLLFKNVKESICLKDIA